ncbi:pantoate--beta-alanine ligase [Flavobacterium sp.]|uniref:pantoate--beta-alanine ligase n=1 Tax=Flavobacterium sp. TaxID=239 RepID=UPI00352724F6
MRIVNKKEDLISLLKSISPNNSSVGFVPTMGALHDGHLSLLRKSVQENTQTVVSIFVNPTQFDNKKDLEKYPRTLEADVAKIKTVSSSIIIYAPTTEDIYGKNIISENFSFDGLENQMEGKHRKGHFNGVGTIVKQLFEIVKPNKAYFGEKDYQQLQIVKKLTSKYKIPVEIIGCPIYREPNGLAMSSRNARLSKEAQEKASVIYKTLQKAKTYFKKHSANATIKMVEKEFEKHHDFKLEYFEIANEKNLLPCKRKTKNQKYRGFIAVYIEGVRLIDTISF